MSEPIVFADTHTHLYSKLFDNDRDAVIKRAIEQGVKYLFLPNIDKMSIQAMHSLVERFPDNCFPMMGLHPCEVHEGLWEGELEVIQKHLFDPQRKYVAVGEIGIDLYWNKSTFEIQKIAFIQQLEWAKALSLPVSVHCRAAITEVMECIEQVQDGTLKGIIHCFDSDIFDAQRVIEAGFLIGIGGVITFKRSYPLREAILGTSLEKIVLETDAPYLAPLPYYRGQRNESAYIPIIAERVAEVKKCTLAEVAEKTTQNALSLFKIDT